LRLAASLEQRSEHPMAAAIVDAARERSLPLAEPTEFNSVTGQGIMGVVDGKKVAVGNVALVRSSLNSDDRAIDIVAFQSLAEAFILIAIDGHYAGSLIVSDRLKATSAQAIRDLRAQGLRVIMLTGDNPETAGKVAKAAGITDFRAQVLPAQKSEVVRELQSQGHIVAMAGDGINDAPALAQANVGIAMGTGTDIAMESGGVTLVKGDLAGIVRARKLSQATMRNISQNLFFAFIYNALGVPIAAGVLYPFFGLLLSPILAAAAMSFSSVSVITNALRLRKVQL
jgi:Cu+-exporting ATPase